MSALFLELASTVLFFSSSPLAFKMRMISSMEFLPPHGEVEKALPVVMLLVSVDDVVGLELLVTTLADKHLATVKPKFLLVMRWQRLESLITYITGVNPLIILCFVPHHSSHPATT